MADHGVMVELDYSNLLDISTEGTPVNQPIINCGTLVEGWYELLSELGNPGIADGLVNNEGTMIEIVALLDILLLIGGTPDSIITNTGEMAELTPVAKPKYPGDNLVELDWQESINRIRLSNKLIDLV